MDKTIQQDDQIMKLLDVSTINRVICHTNKGILTLQIRKGEKNYQLVLDAVPLSKSLNKELMDILFPVPQMEAPKQVNKEPTNEDMKKGILASPFGGTPRSTYKGLNGKGEITLKEINQKVNALKPKKLGRPKKVK